MAECQIVKANQIFLQVKMKRRFTKCLTDLNKVRGIKEPSTKSSVFIYTGNQEIDDTFSSLLNFQLS